jgi:two-component system response regulator FixJ
MNQPIESTVVVVDDDEAVRDSLSVLLEADGWRVKTFPSGDALLATLDASEVSCLVVDVRMPGIDGLELQKRLRERGIDAPVVIVTGHGDIPLAVMAIKNGAFDFIEKPFDNTVILDCVRRAVHERRGAVAQKQHIAETTARIERLTPREREVLELLVTGYANKQIAHQLSISARTVEIHRARVMEKMDARNLSHLVRLALAAGVVPKSP